MSSEDNKDFLTFKYKGEEKRISPIPEDYKKLKEAFFKEFNENENNEFTFYYFDDEEDQNTLDDKTSPSEILDAQKYIINVVKLKNEEEKNEDEKNEDEKKEEEKSNNDDLEQSENPDNQKSKITIETIEEGKIYETTFNNDSSLNRSENKQDNVLFEKNPNNSSLYESSLNLDNNK